LGGWRGWRGWRGRRRRARWREKGKKQARSGKIAIDCSRCACVCVLVMCVRVCA